MGTKKKPFYRIVVSDGRDCPTARVVENLGTYDPRRTPVALQIDLGRADYWIGHGAQPSQTVRGLLRRAREGAA
jgi:small subunit ribosomal protein S16